MSDRVSEITGGRLLARNTVLNFLGPAAPLLVALVAIPPLIEGLGVDRFGVLTLAWMVIGYFSLFDLGLGRSLTQMVSERLGGDEDEDDELPGLIWTGLILMGLLGVLGGLLLALLAGILVERVLNVPAHLQAETTAALRILAVALPLILTNAGLRGVLESTQRFGVVNAIRVPTGMFTFVGPLLVLPFSRSLVPIVVVLAAGRVAAWGVHFVFVVRTVPGLWGRIRIRRSEIRPLFRLGSWITVSNVVSPLMVYFDRFLIGALLSMSALAYYATPYGVVTKLWLIPGALVGVFFPAFATTFVADRERTVELFDQAVRVVFLTVFPLALLILALAHEGLELWIGPEFAEEGAPVARWLVAGVFINCLAQIPFGLLQGVGRPDLTAKLHLLEAPFYGLLVWWCVTEFGITGAAMAWTARVGVDALLLFGLSAYILPGSREVVLRMGRWVVAAGALMTLAAWPVTLEMKVVVLVMSTVGFVAVGWRGLLARRERTMLLELVGVGR